MRNSENLNTPENSEAREVELSVAFPIFSFRSCQWWPAREGFLRSPGDRVQSPFLSFRVDTIWHSLNNWSFTLFASPESQILAHVLSFSQTDTTFSKWNFDTDDWSIFLFLIFVVVSFARFSCEHLLTYHLSFDTPLFFFRKNNSHPDYFWNAHNAELKKIKHIIAETWW